MKPIKRWRVDLEHYIPTNKAISMVLCTKVNREWVWVIRETGKKSKIIGTDVFPVETNYSVYCKTWKQAHQLLLQRSKKRITEIKKQLNQSRDWLSSIEKLQNPEARKNESN